MIPLSRPVLACMLTVAANVAYTTISCADIIVDNFESYTSGQAIATSSSSTPWLRTGTAVSNNLTANATSPLDGLLSGALGLKYDQTTTTKITNANLRYNYVTAQDLSGYGSASVLINSSMANTHTAVQLVIGNGTTTYQSSVSYPITTTKQTLTFSLADLTTLAQGNQTLATVLSGTTSIGFKFTNTVDSGSETVRIDNFILISTPVPEPASLGLLGTGGMLLMSAKRYAR